MNKEVTPPPVQFSMDEANALFDECRFNCGPSALCAVTGRSPREVLAAMPDFVVRGYTNPKMMRRGLTSLCTKWTEVISEDGPVNLNQTIGAFPSFGLARLQWAGRWTNPGVPVRARYRHSHWIGVAGNKVFDINAMCVGGWLPIDEWANQLVPWLLREVEPKATGEWWTTHSWEVEQQGGLL